MKQAFDHRLNRRDFLKAAGAGAAAMAVASAVPEAHSQAGASQRPPNIVYVFADQLRNCSWPLGGDSQVKTPNLEALARQGAVFDHCLSNHPLCSPYRASLLTGRYQQSNTVITNVNDKDAHPLPITEVSIATLLKQAGYATGYVGKWHLYYGTNNEKPVPLGPYRHGFDWWRVCSNYRKRYDTRYPDDNGKEVLIQGYGPKGQMDLTMDFIEKNAKGPFCIFLSWQPPHPPYTEAPKEFLALYPPDKIMLRPNVTDTSPKAKENMLKLRKDLAQYFGHITALDEQVGRLMAKLDQLGIADDTILVYTSDHGDMQGSQGMNSKNKPWEESINVPFVIRWPGKVPAGRRLETLFATVDIAPTLLALAGQPIPPRMEGTDLSAILRGENAQGPESVFIMDDGKGILEGKAAEEAAARNKGKTKGKAGKGGDKAVGIWRGVRTLRHTYVKQVRDGALRPWLLYDNEKDPYQTRNLVADPSHVETRKDLDAMLHGWLKRVGEA